MGYRKTHKIEVVHLTSPPYYSFKAVDNGPYKKGQPSNYLPSQKKREPKTRLEEAPVRMVSQKLSSLKLHWKNTVLLLMKLFPQTL